MGDSGLSINATTGLATRVDGYNGPVILTANITNGCGVAQISHSIWAGTPQITNQRVDNRFYSPRMAICPGNHWLNVTPIGGNPGNASWTVPSGIAHWIGTNTLDFTYPQNYSSSLTITVRASNTCGQGSNYNFFLSKKTFGYTSGFTMVAFPNPTTDNLTVEMMPLSPDVSKLDAPIIDSAILFNTDGVEVANGKKNDRKFVLDVRGLKKGTYFIHVVVDGDLTREQIIIE